MTTQKNIILDSIQIDQKIKRIAYQIYESNSNEKEVILAGIADNGYIFANKIGRMLTEISSIKVIMCEVIIDKKKPLMPITTSITPQHIKINLWY